jgi:hypothetical protein
VEKLDANGQLLVADGATDAGAGEFNGVAITTIDDQGNLYMVDALNHRLQKLGQRQLWFLLFPAQALAVVIVC